MSFTNEEDLLRHLPPYLSESSKRRLVDDLSQFPNSVSSKKFYIPQHGVNELRQGDKFRLVERAVYPQKSFVKASAVLLTNSCSALLENERTLLPHLTFAPLLDFSLLETVAQSNQLKESHLANAIYFPPDEQYEKGTIALLDNTFSLPLNQIIVTELLENRISTLSAFGWYFFLFKLSYWYCRMGEKIIRDKDHTTPIIEKKTNDKAIPIIEETL